MRNLNLGGSWLDEFYRIAEEKGWSVKKEPNVELEEGEVEYPPKVELGPGEVEYPPKVELGPGKVEGPKDKKKFNLFTPGKVETGPMPEEVIPDIKISSELNIDNGVNKMANITQDEMIKYWGSLSNDVKEKLIPEWDQMPGYKLISKIENIWGAILNESRMQEFKRKKDIEGLERAKDIEGFERAKDIEEFQKAKQKDRFGVNPEFVAKLQAFLMNKTGIKVSDPNGEFLGEPDGVWGPRSAVAWNVYAEKVNGGPSGSVPQVVEHIKEDGSEFPRMDNIRYIFSNKADDVMANVINELVALANDLDSLGEKNAANAVDNQIKVYAGKLYDIMGESGEDFINSAHPGGGKTLFPASDEGGKVETILEEQKKIVDKITKKPTGKLAQVVGKLIATANKLDDEGNVEAAKIVDKAIAELLPFEQRRPEIEASGSENYNASVKTADSTTHLIKKWGNLVKTYSSIYNDVINVAYLPISSYLSSGSSYFANYLKNKYKTSYPIVRTITESWPILDLVQLKKQIRSLAKYLDFKDNTFDLFNSLFSDESEANKLEEEHKKMISGLYLLANDMEKVKKEPKKEEPKKEKPIDYLRELQEFKKQRQVEKNKQYIRQLDGFYNFVKTNYDLIEKNIKQEGFVEKLLQWAMGERNEISGGKRNANDKDIKVIEEYINNIRKRIKSASLKTAALPPMLPETKTPSAPTSKKPSVKKEKDEDVRLLQEAMKVFLKIPLKVDGYWGGQTMDAWKTLRETIPQAKLSPATKDYNKLKSVEFPRAMRFMAYLTKKRQKTDAKFSIDGKEYVLSDFGNVSNFIAALDRNYNLQEATHGDEFKKEIYRYLKLIWNKLAGEDGENISLYYGKSFLNDLKSNIINLVRKLNQYGIQHKEEAPGLPELSEKEKSVEKPVEKEKGALPELNLGRKNVGIAGLNYPKLDSIEHVLSAVNYLPNEAFLESMRRFKAKADAAMKSKYAPKSQATSELGKVKQYWNMLYSRLTDVINAMEAFKPEIISRGGHSYYQNAIDQLTAYNDKLQWVRREFRF